MGVKVGTISTTNKSFMRDDYKRKEVRFVIPAHDVITLERRSKLLKRHIPATIG